MSTGLTMQVTAELGQHNGTAVALADMTVLAPPEASLQSWADRITQAHGQAVEAILAVGRLLIDAKRALPHGEWERLFKGHPEAVERPVRFSVRSAQMFMAIAKHPILSKTQCVSFLPPSWGTLYELTRLPIEVLTRGLKAGCITQDMQRSDVLYLQAWYANHTRSPHSRMQQKNLAECYESLEASERAIRTWMVMVDTALRESLQINEQGKIISGVCWLPPFVNVVLPRPRPAPLMHRCECGHVHADRRSAGRLPEPEDHQNASSL